MPTTPATMSAPRPLSLTRGQSRVVLARQRARRMPIYPDSRIEQQISASPRFWRGVAAALAIEAGFGAVCVGAYLLLRRALAAWWLP